MFFFVSSVKAEIFYLLQTLSTTNLRGLPLLHCNLIWKRDQHHLILSFDLHFYPIRFSKPLSCWIYASVPHYKNHLMGLFSSISVVSNFSLIGATNPHLKTLCLVLFHFLRNWSWFSLIYCVCFCVWLMIITPLASNNDCNNVYRCRFW